MAVSSRQAAVRPAGRVRHVNGRGGGRLSFRRQFVLLLVAATLLSTLGTVAAAYFGARAIALRMAEDHAAQDLRMAAQILDSHGQSLAVRDGQLSTDAGYRLNGDPVVVEQITSVVGDNAAIYQVEGAQLVSIASDLPASQSHPAASTGSETVGTPLDGPAYQALMGHCPATPPVPPTCHQHYLGSTVIQNVAYIAAFIPLFDPQGICVGALAVATPLDRIETPLRLLAGMLLLVGLALTTLSIVVAYRVSGPVSQRALAALSGGLDDVGSSAGRLEQVARTQVTRSSRQVGAARHLIEELRALSEVATAMQNGVEMLRASTTEVWAEMSHPGAAPDPHASLRAARQVAVVASQLGGSADQAQAFCQRLRAIMNQVIGEASALRDNGQLTEEHARELTTAIASVEVELGNRLSSHPYGSERARPGVSAGNTPVRQVAAVEARRGRPRLGVAALLGFMRQGTSMGRWAGERRDPGATGPVRIQPDRDSARPPRGEDPGADSWSGNRGRTGDAAGRDDAPPLHGVSHNGVASWPERPARWTGQYPAIDRRSHPPRAPRPGMPPRQPGAAPGATPPGFPPGTPGTQRGPVDSGPQGSGSHPSTTGRQHGAWFSDGADLEDAMRQDAPPPAGAPDVWHPQHPRNSAFGEQMPPPRTSPRQTPPPGGGQWMNDQ